MWPTVVNSQVKMLSLNSKRKWEILMAIKNIKIWHNQESLNNSVVPEKEVSLAGNWKGDLFCMWNITKYWQHNFFFYIPPTYVAMQQNIAQAEKTSYERERIQIAWEFITPHTGKKIRVH